MNERADVLMGGGGMPGSINQRPYPFGAWGRGAFLDNQTILVALAAAGGAVYAWRPLEDPAGERLELVDGRGFNAIAGGGGRFAALTVPAGAAVLYGSLGDRPGAGAADVAPDGTIAFKTSYHANYGITVVEWRPDPDRPGVVVPIETEIADAFPVDVQALVGGRAVWRGGAHGRDPLRPTLPDAMNIRVAENVAGVDVLAYWSNAASALVVEDDGAGVGYMFRTQNGFDHDVVALNGVAILAASRTAGEGPEDLVKVEISRATGLRYLVPADGIPPAWFPAPAFGPITLDPPIDPPKPEPIAVTITAAPATGPAPLTVRAVATITNGPATAITWRWRPRHDPDWRIEVVNPGGDPDHSFHFEAAGEYEINAFAEKEGSRASSEVEIVTATRPPDPPQPKPRTLTKGLTMEIDGKIVQLRGAGLRLIAPDSPGTGIWGSQGGGLAQWRGVLYVGDGNAATRYRATKIAGDRYTFTNVEAECLAGADGGQYSTGLDRQGYHKPTGDTDAGELEQWRVYEGNEIGSIQAQIEQTSDDKHEAGPGKKIVVFPLTVEIVS